MADHYFSKTAALAATRAHSDIVVSTSSNGDAAIEVRVRADTPFTRGQLVKALRHIGDCIICRPDIINID